MPYKTKPLTKEEIKTVLNRLEVIATNNNLKLDELPSYSFPFGQGMSSGSISGIKIYDKNENALFSMSYHQIANEDAYSVKVWIDTTEISMPNSDLLKHLIEQI